MGTLRAKSYGKSYGKNLGSFSLPSRLSGWPLRLFPFDPWWPCRLLGNDSEAERRTVRGELKPQPGRLKRGADGRQIVGVRHAPPNLKIPDRAAGYLRLGR